MNKKYNKNIVFVLLLVSVFMMFTACTSESGNALSPFGPKATNTPTPTSTPSPSPTPTNTPTPTSTPTPTPTPTNTPTPTPATVTISTVGDALLHVTIIRSGLEFGTYRWEGNKYIWMNQKEGNVINYDAMFEHMKDELSAADIAVINQETVLAGTHIDYYAGYPRFNSPTEIGDAEIKAGIDVVLHANNHITDYDEAGIKYTLEYWDQHPEITVLGANHSEEEFNTVKILEKNGIKIAMLNYTYGTNSGLSSGGAWRVDYLNKDKITRDLEFARENADFIVVFPHWGYEYTFTPPDSEVQWSKFFLEQGVDLVVGNHAHVIQPVEWMEREDGHRMLVYYSLGNFVSSMDKANQMLNLMSKVTITKAWDGQAYISEAEAIPLVTHYWKDNYSKPVATCYKLTDYSDELGKKHFLANMNINYLSGLCKDVLKDWYSTEGNVVWKSESEGFEISQ